MPRTRAVFTDEQIAWTAERMLQGETLHPLARAMAEHFGLPTTNFKAFSEAVGRQAPVFTAQFETLFPAFYAAQPLEVRTVIDGLDFAALTPHEVCRMLRLGSVNILVLPWFFERQPEVTRTAAFVRHFIDPSQVTPPRVLQLFLMGRDANQTHDEIAAVLWREAQFDAGQVRSLSILATRARALGLTVPDSRRTPKAVRAAALEAAEAKKLSAPPVKKPKAKVPPLAPAEVAEVAEPAEPDTVIPPTRIDIAVAAAAERAAQEPVAKFEPGPGVLFSELKSVTAALKQCRRPMWDHTEYPDLNKHKFCGRLHTNAHAYCDSCATHMFLSSRRTAVAKPTCQ